MSSIKAVVVSALAVIVSVVILTGIGTAYGLQLFTIDKIGPVIIQEVYAPVAPLPDYSCEECPPMDYLDTLDGWDIPLPADGQTFSVCQPPLALSPDGVCDWMQT